jgi:hypothetical protein
MKTTKKSDSIAGLWAEFMNPGPCEHETEALTTQ